MSAYRVKTIARYGVLFGIALLAFGMCSNASRDSDPYDITCGGEQMSPGDVCISTNSSTGGTYEELVAEKRESMGWNRTYGPRMAGAGAVLAVVGALLLILRGSLTSTPGQPSNPGQRSRDPEWWSGGDES